MASLRDAALAEMAGVIDKVLVTIQENLNKQLEQILKQRDDALRKNVELDRLLNDSENKNRSLLEANEKLREDLRAANEKLNGSASRIRRFIRERV